MKIVPDLPSPWRISGYLYTSDDAVDLGEDMLEAELPGGIVICAGWSEEGDPEGHYVVTVKSGMRYLSPPYCTNDIADAASQVSQMAFDILSKQSVAASSEQR